MRRSGHVLLPTLILSAMTTPTLAANPSLTQTLDALVQPLSLPDGPGAAILILKNGQPLYTRCVGYADVEHKTPITPQTHFRLASVSKQFTAAAILLLVDQGKLSLDTPLTDIFPGLPPYCRPVLLRHLLTHTSGLPDYEDHIPPAITQPLKDVDVLAILASQSALYFPPGSQYRYSNSAYALLALAVEKYAGQRFPDFLRTHLFLPLGMTDTVAYEPGISTIPHRAFGHSPVPASPGTYTRTDQSLTSAVLGDGGIYASLEELAKWDAALYAGRLLKPEMWKQAWSPTTLTEGTTSDYGFGWRLGTYKSHPFVGHGGDTIGFRTHIERYPNDHLTLILLSNRNDIDPHAELRKLADACLPATP